MPPLAPSAPYSVKDYLTGRAKVPPWVAELPQRSFVYGDDLSIAAGAAGRLDLAIQSDSYFLVENIQLISSLQNTLQDIGTVQIVDTTFNQSWSNAPVPIRDIAGWGSRPRYLTVPNILRPTSTLSFTITNNSPSTNQYYLAVGGRKLYKMTESQAKQLTRRLNYQYVLDVKNLVAGANDVKAVCQIFNESDFLCHKMLSYELWNFIIGAAPGVESPEVMMQIRDTSNDMTLFSKKIAARLVCGQLFGRVQNNAQILYSNGDGYQFAKPVEFRRNGIIEGTFDNRSVAGTGEFRIVFEGARVFDPT